jgi:alpha-tubulin suppressor-like RCC1 family protein
MAWGQNDDGKLGIGRTEHFEPLPKKVPLEGIKKLTSGGYHTVVITENGTKKLKFLTNSTSEIFSQSPASSLKN